MCESSLGFYPFRAKWLPHEPPHSRNTHSVLLCSVRISGQTASVSLYSINYSVYITETERVYCAVRTEYLNIIQVNFGSAMAHVASRGLSPRRPRFNLSPVYVQFVVEKVAEDQAFLPEFRFSLSTIFHQCSILMLIYMLHLPQGNTGEV